MRIDIIVAYAFCFYPLLLWIDSGGGGGGGWRVYYHWIAWSCLPAFTLG